MVKFYFRLNLWKISLFGWFIQFFEAKKPKHAHFLHIVTANIKIRWEHKMILRHIVNWNGALNVNMQILLFCQIVMNKTGLDQFKDF
jgi:hypothetical protein